MPPKVSSPPLKKEETKDDTKKEDIKIEESKKLSPTKQSKSDLKEKNEE
jgi:hypothetical protein